MMYLVSATPGTGKTCWVVKQLLEWIELPENKDRKIYANIAGLKIDGVYEPPEDFRECEDGSIIVYDEAQEIEHYSSDSRAGNPVAKALSKHRHRGFDIWFISQDPSLLHKYVLKNIYLHYYLWRPAQRQNIEIFTFARAIVAPTSQDFKNAYDKKWWRFEKQYLQYYTSTVLNTSKKVGSSKKNGVIVTFLIFVCMMAYFIYPAISASKSMKKAPEAKNTHTNSATLATNNTNIPLSAPISTPNAVLVASAPIPTSQPQTIDYEALERKRVATITILGNKCTTTNSYGHYLDISLDECKRLMKRPLEASYLPKNTYTPVNQPQLQAQPQIQPVTQQQIDAQIKQAQTQLNPFGQPQMPQVQSAPQFTQNSANQAVNKNHGAGGA